jgi:hypothetical protein
MMVRGAPKEPAAFRGLLRALGAPMSDAEFKKRLQEMIQLPPLPGEEDDRR